MSVRSLLRRGLIGRVASGPLVSDTFTRADSTTSLGSADTGQAWTAVQGTWGISGNKAYCPLTGAAAPIAVVEASSVPAYYQANVSSTAYATQPPQLLFLYVDVNNHILADITSTAVSLFKRDAGTYTQLGTSAFSPVNGTTYLLRVEYASDTGVLRVLLDETERISYTMTSAEHTKYGASTARSVGFRGGNTSDVSGITWDNAEAA